PPWWAFCGRAAIVILEMAVMVVCFHGPIATLRADVLESTGFNRWRIVLLALVVLLLNHVRNHAAEYRDSRLSRPILAWNGLSSAALVACLWGMAGGRIEPALGHWGQFLLVMAVAAVWGLSALAMWVPRLAQVPYFVGFAAFVTAILWASSYVERFTGLFWSYTGKTTVDLVETLLAPFAGAPVIRPEPFVIGTDAFKVEIKKACGGFQGIGLISMLLGGYLWWFRQIHRFPQSFLLFPIGIGIIWLANAVRITALILVGIWIDPKIAVDGFHSQAGWISFLIVGLGTIWAAQQMSFFSIRAPADDVGLPVGEATSPAGAALAASAAAAVTDGEAAVTHGPSAVACLLPFLVLTAVTILTQAFTSGFNYLYPLRVIAVAAVLWCLRRHYRPGPQPLSVVGIGIGVVTFLVWMALAPADGLEDAEKVAAMDPAQQLGQPWALLWLLFRLAGYTITVPIAEELAFRGFLPRRLIDDDIERVPVGTFTWLSFLASSLAFGVMHGADWQRATLAGLAFALALYHRRRLSDAIVAHATTNAFLGGYVIATGA
ncbi:MAG: exosortase E/protease, VPEID-CTERM system, partial [Planctomycetia bacterium]